MSKYVQRCDECREVRGVTSFRVRRTGGRVATCRWCEARETERQRKIRERVRSLAELRAAESDLTSRLAALRKEIRVVEYEAFALSREAQSFHRLTVAADLPV